MRDLFSFLSLHSVTKNKIKIKKGYICYLTALRAIVLHFPLLPYLVHSNSAPTATSESVLVTGGSTFVQVLCRAARNENNTALLDRR